MKKQEQNINMKYEYFDDNNSDDNDDDKPFPNDVFTKQESDTEFDHAEAIHYASPQRESDNEIDKKEYKEPQREMQTRLRNRQPLTKIVL